MSIALATIRITFFVETTGMVLDTAVPCEHMAPSMNSVPKISRVYVKCTCTHARKHHTHHRSQELVLPPRVQEGHHPAIADLDKRVRTLEQQVQRLKDIAVNRGGPAGQAKQGNNFWYVLTFAGWMMIPLIVVYMYRYRR